MCLAIYPLRLRLPLSLVDDCMPGEERYLMSLERLCKVHTMVLGYLLVARTHQFDQASRCPCKGPLDVYPYKSILAEAISILN